jgi:hypothetical protein
MSSNYAQKANAKRCVQKIIDYHYFCKNRKVCGDCLNEKKTHEIAFFKLINYILLYRLTMIIIFKHY